VAATQIQNAAAKPGAGHSGFFETRVNDATRTLTVLWHGSVPADIRGLIQRLSSSSVHIEITHTAYSLARLNQATHRALRVNPAVTLAYPRSDGSGIVVHVLNAGVTKAVSAFAARLGLPAPTVIIGGVRAQDCVPLIYDTAGPGSRCNDLAPGFWGGDVIMDTTWETQCTGGFGVHDAYGYTYMLTAAHCARLAYGVIGNGADFWNGQENEEMGQAIDVPGNLDAALIPTSAGNRIYDGPGIGQGDTYYTKGVYDENGVSVGDWMCDSGAIGGTLCGMQVTGLYAYDGIWNDMALANSTTGIYTLDGDSGGSWFALTGYPGLVSARGIHHGVTLDPSRRYPTGELFTPMGIISYGMGVWVNT
jgi:hypothetical protein